MSRAGLKVFFLWEGVNFSPYRGQKGGRGKDPCGKGALLPFGMGTTGFLPPRFALQKPSALGRCRPVLCCFTSPLSSAACLQHQSCEMCVTSELTFNCSWCHVLQR